MMQMAFAIWDVDTANKEKFFYSFRRNYWRRSNQKVQDAGFKIEILTQ